MKQLFSKRLNTCLMPYVCFCIAQFGATTATAQNMLDNNAYNNVSQSFSNNINIGGGPNVRGVIMQQGTILSNTNVNSVNRRQTVNVTQTAVRPVTRRSGSSSPATRRQPSANQVIQRRAVVRPVTTVINVPVAIQAPSQLAAPVINLVPENVAAPVEQVVQNNDMLVQSNPVAIAPVPSSNVQGSNTIHRNAGSFSSVSSSKKSSNHRSKKKKRGGFYYAANKKVMKFFAKNSKGKIDPAKCFVWR